MSEIRRTLLLALLALLVLAGVHVAFDVDPLVRQYELFPDMARSLAAESHAACAALPGGVTQQPLPPGVVVRGHLPFPFPATPEGAAAAGSALVNPFAAEDAAARARGAERYAIACAACHGADGQGRGPVVERGMLPPPSLLADRARALPDGHLFHIVTRGQGNMAPHAAQLVAADRWKVILHVRALQGDAR